MIQVGGKADESLRGATAGSAERRTEAEHRLAIGGDGLEKPTLLLTRIVQALGQGKVLAHRAHGGGKGLQRRDQNAILQIPENILPVDDRREIVQGEREERPEVVFFPSGDDRGDDPIQSQVGKEGRFGRSLGRKVETFLKKNAHACHDGIPVHVHEPHGNECACAPI